MAEMDRPTARKLWQIAAARAGLLGKDQSKWTKDDDRRFDIQIAMMPGEFRAWNLWFQDVNYKPNITLAEKRRIGVEAQFRMDACGSDYIMESNGLPESPLARTIPEAPGNTYAMGIADKYITPA